MGFVAIPSTRSRSFKVGSLHIDTKPTLSRRFSRFSITQKTPPRPATADSATSVMSSLSGQRTRTNTLHNKIPETDELSPLDGSFKYNGFGSHSLTQRIGRQNSVSSQAPSINVERERYEQPPYTSPTMHGRSSSGTTGKSGTLEVPQSSSLPSSYGSHFPITERSSSSDSHAGKAPIKSVISSDSGVHLTGPVREAVTDPRTILNVNEAGMITSGTLEGLVQRLITNFSK